MCVRGRESERERGTNANRVRFISSLVCGVMYNTLAVFMRVWKGGRESKKNVFCTTNLVLRSSSVVVVVACFTARRQVPFLDPNKPRRRPSPAIVLSLPVLTLIIPPWLVLIFFSLSLSSHHIHKMEYVVVNVLINLCCYWSSYFPSLIVFSQFPFFAKYNAHCPSQFP